MADTTPRYRVSRRDNFAIRVANRWLRLMASRRCVDLLNEVYRRGLHPLGSGSDDPTDYSDLFDYEDERAADPCDYCSHDNTEHAEDGCRLCPCAVPQ